MESKKKSLSLSFLVFPCLFLSYPGSTICLSSIHFFQGPVLPALMQKGKGINLEIIVLE